MSDGDDAARKERQKQFYTRQREEAQQGMLAGDQGSLERYQKIRSKLSGASAGRADADMARLAAASRKKSARQK